MKPKKAGARPRIPAFLRRLQFNFAKTLWHIPHEWCKITDDNQVDYMALFNAVQEHGVIGDWISPEGRVTKYKYYRPGDGFRYWTMTPTFPGFKNWGRIVNRTRDDNAEEWYAEQIKEAKAWCELRDAGQRLPQDGEPSKRPGKRLDKPDRAELRARAKAKAKELARKRKRKAGPE